MNIFNYFKKAGIDTVDASFYRNPGMKEMSEISLFTRCMADVEHISAAGEKVWEWQRN